MLSYDSAGIAGLHGTAPGPLPRRLVLVMPPWALYPRRRDSLYGHCTSSQRTPLLINPVADCLHFSEDERRLVFFIATAIDLLYGNNGLAKNNLQTSWEREPLYSIRRVIVESFHQRAESHCHVVAKIVLLKIIMALLSLYARSFILYCCFREKKDTCKEFLQKRMHPKKKTETKNTSCRYIFLSFIRIVAFVPEKKSFRLFFW